jgi:hypothetical protein
MQKHSFAHTFRDKIKHGRLNKRGTSTANPKKEHHHGGAVCHGILARHPCHHPHCPLCCHRRCSPAILVTISIALLPSPSLSLATLIAATVVAAAIALVVAFPAPLSSSLLVTLIATTVVAAAIALIVACPAPSFRIPHKPLAGSLKMLHAPAHWRGIRRASQTKIYNLETNEFVSNPPFSKI